MPTPSSLMLRRLAPVWVLALLVASVFSPARADDIDALKGKTIRVVIGTAPGNGTDLMARAFAGTLRKLLPTATLRLQNIPSAGGSAALREVQSARGENVTLAVVSNGPIYSQFATADDSPYDLAAFKWVGALNDNQRVLFMRKALGAASLATLRTLGRQPIATSSDATSPSTIESFLLSAIAGIGLKVVPGVADPVRDTMLLAGDVDVIVSNLASRRAMTEAGVLVPVLRMGDGAYPEAIGSLPKLSEAALPGASVELVYFLESLNRFNGLIAAAPSTGTDDLKALRVAFDQVIDDRDFKAQMAAEGQVLGRPTSGGEMEATFTRLFAGGGDLKAVVRSYLECGQRISEGRASVCR